MLSATSNVRNAMRGVPKFSIFYLTVIIIVTIFAPWIAPFDPIKTEPTNILQEPGWGKHLLGTDHLGRDILSRIIYGARISVVVGFMAVIFSGALGTSVALVSGVARGWVDTILMRLTDGFLALPYLMVAVTVIAILGAGLWNVIFVIALLRWMTYARIIRGEVLTLMQMDYIRLARVAGASNTRIIFRHVAPNVFNTLLVLATLEVGLAIIAEASLELPRVGHTPSAALLGNHAGRVAGMGVRFMVAAHGAGRRHHAAGDVLQPDGRLATRQDGPHAPPAVRIAVGLPRGSTD